MNKNWYTVYTKPGLETKVAEVLSKRKFENYCPLNMIQKQQSDPKKIVYRPLFASFVFVHAEENRQTEIKNISGIVNFMYWLNKPAILDYAEINTIKTFLNEYENIQVQKANVKIVDTAGVLNGSHVNQGGDMISVSSETITALLPSLGFTMKACIKRQNVKLIIKNNSGNYATIR
jgi:transcription antitermination factor NusG